MNAYFVFSQEVFPYLLNKDKPLADVPDFLKEVNEEVSRCRIMRQRLTDPRPVGLNSKKSELGWPRCN